MRYSVRHSMHGHSYISIRIETPLSLYLTFNIADASEARKRNCCVHLPFFFAQCF